MSPEVNFGRGLPCPVCGRDDKTSIRTAFDDRYGHQGTYAIDRCNVCGHQMTSPRLSESELGHLYGTYYPRKHIDVKLLLAEATEVGSIQKRLRRWWDGTNNQGQYSVRPGEEMLDVGCGSGLSLLEAKSLGAEAFGVEADPNVRRIADELGIQVHIGSLHDSPFPGKKFDLIVLNQVIEHIPEPEQILQQLKEYLRPDGRIVLVFPNRRSLWQWLAGDKWINWHIPYHLHHFDANGFRVLAQRLGYRVVRQKTITPTVWTILQFRTMRAIPALPGVPSPIWEVKPETRAAAPASSVAKSVGVGVALRSMARALIFAGLSLINRLVDLTGHGDSILIELRVGEFK